jgi:formylmethanofuran dehydrogenase subunit E
MALGTPNLRDRATLDEQSESRKKTNIATWRRDRGALLTAQTMETKTCARCKETLPKNQENFPHGSSWCTKCCPVSDSDSD